MAAGSRRKGQSGREGVCNGKTEVIRRVLVGENFWRFKKTKI